MVETRSRTRKDKAGRLGTGIRFAIVVSMLFLVLSTIGLGVRFGYQWLRSTPLLNVREVLVECDDQQIRQRVLEALERVRGENLFVIDVAALQGKLLEDPWVASAEVSRGFPNKLTVAIEARRAVAFLRSGGVLYLVDSKGRFFVPGNRVETGELVELRGVKPQKEAGLVRHFMGLVETHGKILCYKNIKAIEVREGSMTVTTRGKGIPLRFSLSRPLKAQFRRAEAILYHLYSSGKYRYVKSVDLWIGQDKAIVALNKKV